MLVHLSVCVCSLSLFHTTRFILNSFAMCVCVCGFVCVHDLCNGRCNMKSGQHFLIEMHLSS